MLFYDLKRTIAEGVRDDIMHGVFDGRIIYAAVRLSLEERIPPETAVVRLAYGAYNRIMDWDIRCIGQLRDLFPQHFPTSLRKRPIIVDFDTDGWHVYSVDKNNEDSP